MLLDVLANLTRKLIIDSVTRFRGNHTTSDRTSHECQVTDDVEQLMTSRFVRPSQRLVVEIAQMMRILMWHTNLVSQCIVTLLRQLILINHDGIVEVATLDETEVEQWFYFSHKNECASRSHFLSKILHMLQHSKLTCQHLRVESNLGIHTEFLIWQNEQMLTMLALHLNLMLYNKVFFVSILFHQTYALDFLNENQSRTVKDGHFGTIQLNQTVVDSRSIKSSHRMLNRTYLHTVLQQDCAALSVSHIFCQTVDDRLIFQVNTLNLVSMMRRGRHECSCNKLTRVQTLSLHGKTILQC